MRSEYEELEDMYKLGEITQAQYQRAYDKLQADD